MTEPSMHGPQGFPGSPVQTGDPNDPDTQGLAPDVRLPEANRYRRDQWFARLMVCLVGLLVLAGMTLASEDYRRVYLGCTLAVGVATIYSMSRFVLAWRKARQQTSNPG